MARPDALARAGRVSTVSLTSSLKKVRNQAIYFEQELIEESSCSKKPSCSLNFLILSRLNKSRCFFPIAFDRMGLCLALYQRCWQLLLAWMFSFFIAMVLFEKLNTHHRFVCLLSDYIIL
jgi:hypothetical protein